jgi:hypothetical protein
MVGEERYVARIRALGKPELVDLWNKLVLATPVEGWEPGRALEHVVLRAFELEGAEVVWPYRNAREQVDGAVYVDGRMHLLESKDWSRLVDATPVARMKMMLEHRPHGVAGMIFSRGGFTEAAKYEVEFNPARNILLWRGSELSLALESSMMCAGLRIKWRHAMQHGNMDYELTRRDFK